MSLCRSNRCTSNHCRSRAAPFRRPPRNQRLPDYRLLPDLAYGAPGLCHAHGCGPPQQAAARRTWRADLLAVRPNGQGEYRDARAPHFESIDGASGRGWSSCRPARRFAASARVSHSSASFSQLTLSYSVLVCIAFSGHMSAFRLYGLGSGIAAHALRRAGDKSKQTGGHTAKFRRL